MKAIVYEYPDGSYVAVGTKDKKLLENVENALYDSNIPAPTSWTVGIGGNFESAVAKALFNSVCHSYYGAGKICANCVNYRAVERGRGFCRRSGRVRQADKNYRCRYFF